MSLSRRALEPQTRVLVIDDFHESRSSARGLVDLVAEFRAGSSGDRRVGKR